MKKIILLSVIVVAMAHVVYALDSKSSVSCVTSGSDHVLVINIAGQGAFKFACPGECVQGACVTKKAPEISDAFYRELKKTHPAELEKLLAQPVSKK